MITELSIQNFKSWKNTGKLQIAPLTGFFGANSSGKTSILQTLLMLKQTVERPENWNGIIDFGDDNSLVYLGTFDDLIYQHKRDSTLGISLSWKLHEKLNLMEEKEIDILSYDFNLLNVQNSDSNILFNYKFGNTKYEIKSRRGGGYVAFKDDEVIGYIRSLRCYGIQDGDFNRMQLFSTLQTQFENLFRSIRYLGPLREYPRRNYAWQGKHTAGVGQHGEDMVTALFSGRIQLRSFEEEIPKWLKRLDLIHSYRLKPITPTEKDYEFLVRKYKDGPEVRLTDVGFGVSQVLPVLVLCYYVPEGSILILEQPEAHLHPKVQSELADLLIEVVNKRNLQIILESHSENLIVRLMRRIAEEKISNKDTAFYFCEMNEGTSEIDKLNIDDYGNIENWPENFFGDATGDLMEKTMAEMKRKEEQGL
ncbi:MAG: DUF3696 domain-containing protein [Candidatus Poribacteria bacterium]|nr:DUF3696 domain-containing protein [Candidatus Poribacteria bacterium]